MQRRRDMTEETIAAMIEEMDLPLAYHHFAEGEAETRKDWDIRLDAGRLGVWGHTDPGSDVPRLTPT